MLQQHPDAKTQERCPLPVWQMGSHDDDLVILHGMTWHRTGMGELGYPKLGGSLQTRPQPPRGSGFRGKFNPGEAGAGLRGGMKGEREGQGQESSASCQHMRGLLQSKLGDSGCQDMAQLCPVPKSCQEGSGYSQCICTLQQRCPLPCTPKQLSQQGQPHRSDLPRGTGLESRHKSTAHSWSSLKSLPNTR